MNHIPRDQRPTNPSWRPPQHRPEFDAGDGMPQDPSFALAKSIAVKFSVTAALLYGGLVFAAFSLFLPWTTVSARVVYGGSTTVDASPFRGGWILPVLLVIAGAGFLAWPTISGSQMLVRRLAGLTGTVGLLGVFFLIGLVNYANGLSEKQKAMAEAGKGFEFLAGGIDVSLGFGFVLYAAALLAIAGGLGTVWMQRLTAGKRAR